MTNDSAPSYIRTGRQAWGESHGCADATQVGPPEQAPCDGSYRHFPGQTFDASGDFEWTCPFSANYVLQVTANCDVPCERARPSFSPADTSVTFC